jgi:hypothetical protein
MSDNQPVQRMVPEPSMQVSGPSVGLLITGILGAITSVGTLISLIIGAGLTSRWLNELPDWEFNEEILDLYEGVFGIGSAFVGLILSAFIIFASIKMKDLQQWNLCMAASIVAMIPCISPCCIVGLPIGIWCLVVLNRPEVRSAFH